MSDDELTLRSLLEAATRDLHAPPAPPHLQRTGVPPRTGRTGGPARRRPRRALVVTTAAATAAATGAAAALAAVLWSGAGTPSSPTGHDPSSRAPGAGAAAAAVPATGSTALYRLAASVRALPTPTGRYAVQVEQQTERRTTYLKATIIDSRTGDAWTYQRGPGVPAALPKAPGFSPTEAQLQAGFPTDPAALKQALIARARAAAPDSPTPQSPDGLAVTEAIDTLWNPLVKPPLRAALVSVIASCAGVVTDARAIDARGRAAIKIRYNDARLGVEWSVFLDPVTGAVLESAESPAATADPGLAGDDVYLSHYWTDAPPTSNPLATRAR